MNMERLYSPREGSRLLGVCIKTIQDWDNAGRIRCVRTPTGRRRTPESEINRVQGEREIRHPAIYARVSSRDQARDLENQVNRLKQRFPGAEVYRDTSSRLKFDRQSFLNLLKAVQEKRISSVIVTHRGRLARSGFDLLQLIFKNYGTDIETVSQDEDTTPQDELVKDNHDNH
jgi:putative resolvase